jgi:ABC-2 type transport system permease protein
VRIGWLECFANLPPSTMLAATLPRGVLQIVFFTVLGGVLAGPQHREFAFVGALVLALTGTNILDVVSVPLSDKANGTFWRIRTGAVPVTAVLVARSLPYIVVGFGLFLAEAAVAAPVLGLTGFAVRMLPWLWIFAVMAYTFGILVLAAAALTISKRADVLAPNVLAFLTLLCSGAVVPPGRVGWIDAIGTVLPVRHGLAAIHAATNGRPWLAELGLELAVGVACAVLTVLVVRIQTHRASRHGHDDFA